MAEDKIQQVMETIEGLTVTELAALVKELKEKFDISAPAFVAGAMPAGGAAAPAEEEGEEQTEFNVMLNSIGDKKINVIKAVREVTSLGLKEAKELVESAPCKVKEGVNKAEAEEVKAKIEAAGGSVEIIEE